MTNLTLNHRDGTESAAGSDELSRFIHFTMKPEPKSFAWCLGLYRDLVGKLLRDEKVTARELSQIGEFTGCFRVPNDIGASYSISVLEQVEYLERNAVYLRRIEQMAEMTTKPWEQVQYLSDYATQRLIDSQIAREYHFMNLVHLTDTQASILASFKGSGLAFLMLRSINDAQAKALSTFGGTTLRLDITDNVTPDQIRTLGNCNEKLELAMRGLNSLTNDQAKAFSEFKGAWLKLNGITSLTDEAWENLMSTSNEYVLEMEHLKWVTDKQAETIGKGQRWGLFLNGLTKLTDAQLIAILKNRKMHLSLSGLTSFSPVQFKKFLESDSDHIYLDGVTELTDMHLAVLKATPEHKRIYLRGITTCTNAQAEILIGLKDRILFDHKFLDELELRTS
jgi:hypothetical protein